MNCVGNRHLLRREAIFLLDAQVQGGKRRERCKADYQKCQFILNRTLHKKRQIHCKATPSNDSSASVTISNNSNARFTSYKEECSKVLQFVGPSIVTVLLSHLLSLTDTAFVGRCAKTPLESSINLAALSQATILCDYAPLLAAFVSTASLNLTSGYLANDDYDNATSVTSTAFIVSLLLGLCMALVIYWLPFPILKIQGVSGDVLDQAVAYCKGRSFGTPLSTITATACASLAARKNTMLPLVGALIAAVMNVCFDFLFVSILQLQVQGAAWATSLSQAICALIIVQSCRKRKYLNRFASIDHLQSIFAFAGTTNICRLIN